MFPPQGKANKDSKRLFLIVATVHPTKSPSFSYWNQNVIIRGVMSSNASGSHYPKNPVQQTAFSRRSLTKCVYFSQGFGLISLPRVVSDAFGRPIVSSNFICQGHVTRNDNGHCEATDEWILVIGNTIFHKRPGFATITLADLRGINIHRDIISVTILVYLSDQFVLEYPLTRSVTIDDALQQLIVSFDTQGLKRKQVIGEERRGVELENVVPLGRNTTCLCCQWTYLPFCMCDNTMNHQPATVDTTLMADSMDGQSSSSDARNYGCNPEESHIAPYNDPTVMGISQHFEGPTEASMNFLPNNHANLQLDSHVSAPYFMGENVDLIPPQQQYPYGQTAKVPPRYPLFVEIPDENQNMVYTPPGEMTMAGMAQNGMEAMQGQSPGIGWDQSQMLLQTCPEFMGQRDDFTPPPDEVFVSDISPAIPSPPFLPSYPMEAGGPGNVAASWQVGGWGDGRASNAAISTRGHLKRISASSTKQKKSTTAIRMPRRNTRPAPMPQTRRNDNNRANPGASFNDLVAHLVVHMFGYMENKEFSKDNPSLAKTTTNTSESQSSSQGGASGHAAAGYDASGNLMGSSSGTPPQPTTAPQQYILGCAGSSRGQDGRQERDTDGSTITLKMLLETPYSPRGRSTRNRELEEYQRILAEDELQRRIDEFKKRDKEKKKNGDSNKGNDDDRDFSETF